ncbi:GNAT family N-acetyltransferase [Kutzneria buriramensis]|uniref:RimJ/RimL family protein N-acetyltransferase n=1 Tax=Kutzneria buriramensis TaxID=1045776 RepID=A0A3E0GTK4_9PSEU|nr:GNAT family N-acetyltransferase [Kutzneria buriramensis]REH27053.1 RimJ/RimL family protein N-acetyltransferase [Kutzneria buriramensis]
MSELPTLSAVRIEAERVVLRGSCEADRDRLIELRTDPEVGAYIGGPSERAAVEKRIDEVGMANLTKAPGLFAIADKATDVFLGTMQLMRTAADEPGHLTEGAEELELGYLLHRDAWGAGFAFEAATAVLRAAAAELPDQPVILRTQTANTRSLRLAARLGFRPVRTYEAYDAEQTLSAADLHSFKASTL